LGIRYIFMSQRVKESVTGGRFWPDPADACPAVPGKAGQAVGIGMLMTIVVIGFGSSSCCIAA
jgi:hypothetical protein